MRSPVARIVGACAARPWITLVIALVVAATASWIVATRFAMTTDTAALISPDVDWRRQEQAMETAFPGLTDVMVVVIDARTPELAEDAAARLAARMGADPAHFRRVRRPDGGPFFAREGLLFGTRDEVRRSTAALIEAQPLLGPLAADPSLRGIAGAIGMLLDGVERDATTLDRAAAPMGALAQTIDRSLTGRPAFFSWQALFARGAGPLAPPTRRLILAQPVLDHGDLMPGHAAGDAVRTIARDLGLGARAGIDVRLTGEVPLADEEFATLQENMGMVALAMAAAMLVTLWLGTRSLRLVAAIVATIVMGLVSTSAVGLLVIGRFNLISVAFIPLFVGLGVDFGIQLCVRFLADRATGLTVPDALRTAAEALGPSLLLAAGAVFLGFGAFLPTAYVGIAELGVIAGLGMAIALAFTITLLPALIVLLRPRRPRREMGIAALVPVDRWLERRRRLVLWSFALSMLASIALLPWVRFDFDPLHLRDPAAPAMRTLTDLARDPDRSPATIDVLAPDTRTAASLARRLARLPEVRQVVSLDSFVPVDQPPKLALIDDAALLLDTTLNPLDLAPPPDDAATVAALTAVADRLAAASTGAAGGAAARRLAAAFAALARAPAARRARVEAVLIDPLTVMLDQARLALQARPVTIATLPADLRADWVAADGRRRLQVFSAGDAGDDAVQRRFRDAVARVTPAISGLPVATQAAAATVAGAFVQAGVIAFLAVSLLLFAILRDTREVAFTLAPVILSIFLTLGTCVLIGQPINFANIIAFPLLFGVGVAFHIYFVMAWRGGATGLLPSSLARAILFSALATGTAFGSLWLSRHPGTASMGKILMISLAWTLVCALIFEPALLGPPRRRAPA